MLKPLLDWLDNRSSYRAVIHEALEEPIPGGPRWRYVFGSALSATFMIQLVTGLLLMTSYSPSATTAWGSVFYISHDMAGGWFLRGIHHFGSQAMIVLLGMHLVQVVIAGAYRAPRELNWWFGLVLLFLTLGLSLTGYLLPWDQKGYWATKVATNIMGSVPLIGPSLQRVVIGGSDYGNQTLTRFYGLHVGVLPLLLILAVVVHVALFRKHGITPPKKAQGIGKFWPEQVFMDSVASFVVLVVIAGLTLWEGGANLDAPADPAGGDYPPRPEWYFLSLFQLLKNPAFAGSKEVLGTVVVPTAVLFVLAIMPLLDKILPRGFAHFLSCGFVFALIGGAGYLTVEAFRSDAKDNGFQAARARADQARDRALSLAGDPKVGIPPEGAAYLLSRDPYWKGRAIVESKCLGCHMFDGKRSTDAPALPAAELKGHGTRQWVRALLENPDSPHYFAGLRKLDATLAGMRSWKKNSKATPKDLDDLADFVVSLGEIKDDLPSAIVTAAGDEKKDKSYALFTKECGTCHTLGDAGENAPNLFGWGSPAYFRRLLRTPAAPDLYGFVSKSCQMPSFVDSLSETDLDAVYRYLKGDYPPVLEKSKSTETPRAARP
ncbi:MAG: hypothetical protein NVSMB14_05050 [Isosphaeraceae bacterium]